MRPSASPLVVLLASAGLFVTRSSPASSDAGRTVRQSARTIEITSPVAPVRQEPDAESAMLGTVHGGTRLEFGEERAGAGCRGPYVALRSGGWVCSRNAAYSSLAETGVELPLLRPGRLVPHRYVSTQRADTPAYASPEDHFLNVVAATHGRGFAFASFGRRDVQGVSFERLENGTFVLAADVAVARPSRFEGIELTPGETLDHAFALEETHATAAPGAPARSGRLVPRRSVLHVAAMEGDYVRLVDGAFVPRESVRVVSRAPLPPGVGADEPWIDVHIAEQVLVLYRGTRPEFVTLVSSGADRPGRRTPTGVFRIGSKYAETTMDDAGNTNPNEDYLVERVPWVQYFDGSVAFHAAFWHDDFGRRRSHGCINLAPLDARRLFGRTAPALPPGFSTRQATSSNPGTLVNVRP